MGEAMIRQIKLVLPLAVALSVLSCNKGGDAIQATPLQLSPACDVKIGCVAAAGDLSLRFSMGPDLRVLTPFPVRVEVQGEQRVDSITAIFAMRGMDMGMNRYQLISDGANRWLGNVTLPVCTSGRSDWIANLEVVAEGRSFAVEIPFVIDK
jgi:hypothetical protein